MNAFTLGRMRHLDLLALWHELHPNARQRDQQLAAGCSKDQLAAVILQAAT